MKPLARRPLLALPFLLLGRHAARAQAVLPASSALLVPGPESGWHARWAERLAASLAPTLALQPACLGGPDGVTAANRFAAEDPAEVRGLLAFPGAAAHARLIGDSRAKFDPSGWLPVCASLGSTVVAGLGPRPTRAAPGTLKVAMPSAESATAAALLALDLLGLTAEPRPGLPGLESDATVALFSGPDLPARLTAAGATPWFMLEAGPGERDPLLADLPTLAELAPAAPAPLLAAARAAGASARLLAVLMLPALTSADQVALWRGAAQRWVEEEGRTPYPRAVPAAEAAALLTLAAPPPDAVLAYREWLLRRLGWQP